MTMEQQYLKELTELNGVSGDEDEVRRFISSKAGHLADESRVDSMGNLILYKKGRSGKYRIMLSAHMDEVGFIITGYGDCGTLKFKPVGGIDERILPGKRVFVGDKKIPGVIGSKPIHMQDKEERKANPRLKSMYIDIGADNREEAERFVTRGEYAAFCSDYAELGDDCVKAKALDDRVGCAILMDALKGDYEFDLYVCFTVQEEVGLRGSEIAAYSVEPDIALVIEGTTCSDVPGVEKHDYSTVMGGGAALTIMDRTAYAAPNLVDYIYKLAKGAGIDVQYKQTTTGGNDAGKIQRSRGGVSVASISVPCRYIHSPVSVMSKKDFQSCLSITRLVLRSLSDDVKLIGKLKDGGYIDVQSGK
ncbi:endoglucanase [Anaerobacterium chartisolvens]|uniref:Endoglucanase n=1 Tax=Anaerobacterium chartisolvens TaxID=1297424 RepID=A0A369B4Y0_9FIRM|nr:M42 family metallopeptidase [Anaerobacterium chartisolvens]RCX16375.1 endoglucanase [Anaerobacterium chartisolvens]